MNRRSFLKAVVAAAALAATPEAAAEIVTVAPTVYGAEIPMMAYIEMRRAEMFKRLTADLECMFFFGEHSRALKGVPSWIAETS